MFKRQCNITGVEAYIFSNFFNDETEIENIYLNHILHNQAIQRTKAADFIVIVRQHKKEKQCEKHNNTNSAINPCLIQCQVIQLCCNMLIRI